jgi:hypothetical protein
MEAREMILAICAAGFRLIERRPEISLSPIYLQMPDSI